MAGSHRGVRGRSFVVGAMVIGGASLLAACGSSSSSSTTTTAASPSTTAAGGDTAARLSALATDVQSAQKSTFQAVYSASGSSGISTITLAKSPPQELFSSTDSTGAVTSLINTGTTTYSCSGGGSGGSAVTCTTIGGKAASAALTNIIHVYDGTAALTVFKAWQSAIVSRVAGAGLTFNSATIAGQPSTCANWSRGSESATYCVTTSGVLAKVEASGGSSGSGASFVLTSYTTSPPASLFAVPQGATVVTLPAGVTAP